MPEADVDYPGTWNRFMDWFSTGVKWIPHLIKNDIFSIAESGHNKKSYNLENE